MFQAIKPRSIQCASCGKKATELFFGIGFPGWLRLMSIVDPETQANPIICPECTRLLESWLNKRAKIISTQPEKKIEKGKKK